MAFCLVFLLFLIFIFFGNSSYMNWGVLSGCTRIVAELNSYSIDFHASIILSCVLIGNYVSAHMWSRED